LRLREATSSLADLAESAFQTVLDDVDVEHTDVERLVLCSGKLYYDIHAHELRAATPAVAVARLEQLYPFPLEQMTTLIASYPSVREIVWAQEEPQNMGAWRSIRHRLEEAASQAARVSRVQYVGRTWRASTSEGYPTLHQYEQDRIVRAALGADAA
jgi:2-oxoglutarate dehydrogenase E1 component